MNAYSEPVLEIVSNRLHASQSMEELEATIEQLGKALGAKYFVYYSYLPLLHEFNNLTNVSQEWFDRYCQKNYRQHDPRILHGISRSEPFLWDDIILTDNSKKSIQRQVMQEAESFGLGDGVSIPVHGVGSEVAIFNLASPKGQLPEYDAEDMALLTLVAHAIHNKFKHIRCDNNTKIHVRTKLSQREQEVMNWTVLGKTSREIAKILDCAEGTVAFHIRNVAEKLDTSNRAQSVATVLSEAYIKPYANLDELEGHQNTGIAMRLDSDKK